MDSKKEFNDLMERIEYKEFDLVVNTKRIERISQIKRDLEYLYKLMNNHVDNHFVFGLYESRMNFKDI